MDSAFAADFSDSFVTFFSESGGGVTVDERKSLPLAGVDEVTVDVVSAGVRVVEGTDDTLDVWLHGTAVRSDAAHEPRLVADTRLDFYKLYDDEAPTLEQPNVGSSSRAATPAAVPPWARSSRR